MRAPGTRSAWRETVDSEHGFGPRHIGVEAEVTLRHDHELQMTAPHRRGSTLYVRRFFTKMTFQAIVRKQMEAQRGNADVTKG
jgi:hypothetical protein